MPCPVAPSRDEPLDRFLSGQDGVFDLALREISQGQKRTHLMWFVFPQLRGLGHSDMAHLYGIASLDEAVSFLGHPVLGPRLRLAVNTLQDVVGKSAEEVFGPVDSKKLRSSLTLFRRVDSSGLFEAALQQWFGGHEDEATLKLLSDPFK
jgi:uncharacterized protein (DUF1810 family)